MTRAKLPQPSALDRLIGVFSPAAMNRRIGEKVKTERYRALAATRGGYDAGDRSRRSLASARRFEGSADAALLPVAEDLRSLSSNEVRNNPLAFGALDTISTKVIGGGLQLQSRPDRKALSLSDEAAKKIENRLEALWRHLSETIDYDGRYHLGQLEWLWQFSELEFGDCWIIITEERVPGHLFDMKVQTVEASRVCNPDNARDTDEIAGGVEFDKKGRPVAIHVANRNPLDFSSTTQNPLKWVRVPIFGAKTGQRNVIQLITPTRAGQTRGAPILAPIIEDLKQISDLKRAEITAAVLSSCYAVVTKTENGAGAPTLSETKPAAGDFNRVSLTLEPGTMLEGLLPNESVESFAPARPNPEFAPFYEAIAKEMAPALGLSAGVLLRHFTASYSASRGELLQVMEIMMRRRTSRARAVNQILYTRMCAEAVERGYIGLPGWFDVLMRQAWTKARWVGPSQGQLNPLDEVNAAIRKIEGGLSTEEEQTAELCGGDYDANQDQRDREIARRRDRGETATDANPPQERERPDPSDDSDDETEEPS